MSANVGSADRIVRFVVGILLIVAPFVTHFALWQSAVFHWGAVVVGVVLVLTALVRFCPLYRLIGANTCRTT